MSYKLHVSPYRFYKYSNSYDCALIGQLKLQGLAQKMKFSIKDLFSKFSWKLQICSDLLEELLMENFLFCAVILEKIFIKTQLNCQYKRYGYFSHWKSIFSRGYTSLSECE